MLKKRHILLDILEIALTENLSTTIEYKPIINTNRVYQDFSVHNIDYRVEAVLIKAYSSYDNIVLLGFYNMTKNIETLTNDAENSMMVFGIVFNWINDLIDDLESGRFKFDPKHIVVSSKSDGDAKIYQKRTRLYFKMVSKFLALRPEYHLEDNISNIKIPDKYKDIPNTLFVVSK